MKGTKSVKNEGVSCHVKSAQHKGSMAIKSSVEKQQRADLQPIEESILKMEDSVAE